MAEKKTKKEAKKWVIKRPRCKFRWKGKVYKTGDTVDISDSDARKYPRLWVCG